MLLCFQDKIRKPYNRQRSSQMVIAAPALVQEMATSKWGDSSKVILETASTRNTSIVLTFSGGSHAVFQFWHSQIRAL